MATPRLDLIGIVTGDLAASLRFYQLLGFPVPTELDDHVECKLDNGLRVAWDTLELIQSISSDWQTPVGHRMGLAFLCESPSAVDARYESVIAAGFRGHREPWDAFWGQRYAQVEDPDGNLVDLFAPLDQV